MDQLFLNRWLLDALDIVLVAIIIYQIFLILRGTQAIWVLAGLFFIFLSYLGARYLELFTLEWLLESKPEALIVARGWRDSVRIPEELTGSGEVRVYALPTDGALSLFNTLLSQGVRVAIHVHSTC